MLLPLLLLSGGCKEKKAPPQLPEVQVMTAEPTNMPIYEEWIGALDGFVNAQIRAQVTGYLMVQNYKEGSHVKQGDLLFTIDPRPFQAAIDQAKAKLAQDKAQQGKTELDVKRYTPLAKQQAISQEELDNAVQANLAAIAQIKADEAAIESAQLNLDFTKITSPVDGLAGRALAQVGDLLSVSGPLLTTVSAIDPIKVFFSVNEQSYFSFWQHHIGKGQSNSDISLELILSDGSIYPKKGKFFFADRQVDPNTGTLQIVGTFENPDYVLRPGQYARVRVQTGVQEGAVMVPQRAVSELQGSYLVKVVAKDGNGKNKAHIKTVKVGPQIGSNWVINEGLSAGDQIIVEGTQRAGEDTEVTPKPFNNPANGKAVSSTTGGQTNGMPLLGASEHR